VENFYGKLRDELLNRELFLSREEARWVIDHWRLDYNHRRVHSSLNYLTRAAYAARCSSCRVDPGDCSPRPLAEPDLWTNTSGSSSYCLIARTAVAA
jgi:putative transposase